MERESQPSPEKSIDPATLEKVVEAFLQESEEHKTSCLDLKDEIVRIVMQWFVEKKDELEKDFEDFYPQARPASEDLIARIRLVLPLNRIHAEGVGLRFVQTKAVSHWADQIYAKVLTDVFKK